MINKLYFILALLLVTLSPAQEIFANVQVNYSQIGGTNTQVFKTLERSLQDFINNTSWTGRKLQNFEKIKSNVSLVINERPGNNNFKGSIVIQSVRPVYNTNYESPILNINDTNFNFEYTENENLVFNERQFSGKNLTDVISFYVYLILGYDADSFQQLGGNPYFATAQKISQNSQNQKYSGWSQMEGTRTRGYLIDNLLKPDNQTLRIIYYDYHRNGLDIMGDQNQNNAKQNIYNALLKLNTYESNFQMNYPFNIFIESKKDEIYKLFKDNKSAAVNLSTLKTLMSTFDPKDNDKYWNKW